MQAICGRFDSDGLHATIAQPVERLLCKERVVGSIPTGGPFDSSTYGFGAIEAYGCASVAKQPRFLKIPLIKKRMGTIRLLVSLEENGASS